jgi:hypothetical protein
MSSIEGKRERHRTLRGGWEVGGTADLALKRQAIQIAPFQGEQALCPELYTLEILGWNEPGFNAHFWSLQELRATRPIIVY